MANHQTNLILRLIDNVSAPARAVGRVLDALNQQINVFHRQNPLRQGVQQMNRQMQMLGRNAQNVSATLSAPLGFAGWFGAEAVYEFEKAMNAMEAFGQLTKQQRGELEQYIQVLNEKFPQTNRQIAETGQELFRGGFNYEQVKGALAGALQLQMIGQGDIDNAQAGDYITNIMRALRLPIASPQQALESATKVIDALAYASVRSNASIRQMSETFKYAAPIAAATGMDIEKLSVLAMELANNGIKASESGVFIRSALVRMLRPTKPMLGALSALNVNLSDFVKFGQQIEPDKLIAVLQSSGIPSAMLNPIIPDIRKTLDDPQLKGNVQAMAAELTDMIATAVNDESIIARDTLSEAITDALLLGASEVDLVGFIQEIYKAGGNAGHVAALFDQRQGGRALAIFGADLDAQIDKFRKEYAGFANKTVDVMIQGIVGAVARLTAAWENLFLAIADSGVLDSVIRAMNATAEFLRNMSATNPELLEMGTYAVMALAVIGPLGMAIGGLASLVGVLAAPISMVVTALAALSAGAWIAIAAIGALAAFISRNSASIVAGAQGFWQGLTSGMDPQALMIINREIDIFLDGLAKLFDFQSAPNQNTAGWASWGEAVGKAVARAASEIVLFIEHMTNLGPILRGMSGTVAIAFQMMWNSVRQSASSLAADIKAKFDEIVYKARAVAAVMFVTGQRIIQNLWDGMKSTAAGLLDWVAGIASSIGKAFGSIRLGNLNPFAGNSGNSGPAPGSGVPFGGPRARGGPIHRGKIYMAGEKGVELFRAGSSGYMHNAKQTRSMFGGGGVILKSTFHINGAQSPAAVADAVGRKLEHLLGRSKQLSLEGRTVFE